MALETVHWLNVKDPDCFVLDGGIRACGRKDVKLLFTTTYTINM
jgi:hypothetical protein